MEKDAKGIVKGLNFKLSPKEMREVIPRESKGCDCCTTNLGYVCADCPSGSGTAAAKSSGR